MLLIVHLLLINNKENVNDNTMVEEMKGHMTAVAPLEQDERNCNNTSSNIQMTVILRRLRTKLRGANNSVSPIGIILDFQPAVLIV